MSSTGGIAERSTGTFWMNQRACVAAGRAEIVEMIGRARNAGGFRAGPMLVEILVEAVAALGRLDEGEGDAAGPGRRPVDRGLVFGDVGAVNGIVPGRAAVPFMRLGVGEARRAHGNRRAAGRRRQRHKIADGRAGAKQRQRDEGRETAHRISRAGISRSLMGCRCRCPSGDRPTASPDSPFLCMSLSQNRSCTFGRHASCDRRSWLIIRLTALDKNPDFAEAMAANR